MVLRPVRVQKYYKLRLQSAINIYLPVLSANNLVPFSTWGYAVGIVCMMCYVIYEYVHAYVYTLVYMILGHAVCYYWGEGGEEMLFVCDRSGSLL